MSYPSPLAFNIATPAMLGWMAAAAVPLLIHLWSKRRYREMSWAAMEYLLAAVRNSRRKFTVEQWLLLAVRTLLVVLVVLAVAEPFLAGGPLAFAPGERTLRVLVLDGSFSMAYTPGDSSRLDDAKALAAEIVDQCPQGDGFALVLMSTPARIIVGTPVFEPDEFLMQLESVAVEHTEADLASSLAAVEKVLADARDQYPRLRRQEVYFLSDLGRVGWAVNEGQAGAAEQVRNRAQQIARQATLVVLDVGQPGEQNAAVTSLRTSSPFVTLADSVDLVADIKSFSRTARDRQSIELVVNDRRVRQQEVALPAGGEVSVVFNYRFEAAGDQAVEVRLTPDRLEIDDHRYLAVPVKQAIQVLCVDGRPSGRPFGGATGFLARALAPQEETNVGGRVRPQVVPESALLELDLGRYDAIFLADVAQFTPSEAEVLESYVRRGGSLVFFVGPQVLADRYNRELCGKSLGEQGVDLLPARLGPLVDEPQFRLDPLEYKHPIVRPFRDRERAGLLTTPVRKHYKLILPDNSHCKVVLATGDGDPLVAEHTPYAGGGRVVLVGTSADVSWTGMPMWPSYVPIVQELLAFSVAGELSERNVEVGQPLGDSLADPTLQNNAALSVRLPGGRSEPVETNNESSTAAWSFPDTKISGFYTVEFGPPAETSRLYAVNVDTTESDLARITPEELREEIWPGVPLEYRTTWQESNAASAGPSLRTSSLARALLYAVLVLLFLETFLARRFGHHGT